MNQTDFIKAVEDGISEEVEMLLEEPGIDPSMDNNLAYRIAKIKGYHDIVSVLAMDGRVKLEDTLRTYDGLCALILSGDGFTFRGSFVADDINVVNNLCILAVEQNNWEILTDIWNATNLPSSKAVITFDLTFGENRLLRTSKDTQITEWLNSFPAVRLKEAEILK
jgi:hypothetical protein